MTLKQELAQLYSEGAYRSETGTRFNPLIEFFIRLSRVVRKWRIKRFVRRGSLLDIGCGPGLFLDIMRKDGWSVAGTEFSPAMAAQVSRTYGVPVVCGEPSSWNLRDGSFDVITMSHVLEHLLTPAEMIEKCGWLLKKGGVLICATPNFMSLQSCAGKGLWFHLDIPYHTHHFSEAGLVMLLRRHAFSIARIRRFDMEYDPFGWLQTLLNLSGISRNYLYSLLKNPALRKQELAGTGKRDMLLTLLFLPFYLPIAFLLSLIESLVLKRGGSVEVYAVKE